MIFLIDIFMMILIFGLLPSIFTYNRFEEIFIDYFPSCFSIGGKQMFI